MKIVRIRRYSGPHFPTFGLNADQNNSENGHFLRTESLKSVLRFYQISFIFLKLSERLFEKHCWIASSKNLLKNLPKFLLQKLQ